MPLTSLTQRLSWWKPDWWTPLRTDAALAAGLLGVQVLLAYAQPGWRMKTDLVTMLWSAVTLLPVVIRRTHLWLAIGATAAFTAVGLLWPDSLLGGQGVALWVLAYTAAAHQRWWRALLGTAALWLVNDLIWVWAYQHDFMVAADGTKLITMSAGIVINLVVMVITFLIGRTVRARREAATALAERALAAESSRQAHAEQAVAEERRRIARELHDVVAHHVSVIGVMSTGARRMLHRDPAAADEALATIEQTSRTTLRELRRLLFVLRSEGGRDDDAGRSPQPGLSALRTLVEQVCEAGLSTSLRVDGELGEVDPGVALTAYRIVQEALTNALKHAGPARAEVRLTVDGRLLTIEVFDTGRGPYARTLSADGITVGAVTGHGLLGMRERVAVYGGTLRTGPRPGGGFRVHARIPIEQAGAAGAAAPEAEAEVAG